MMKNMLNRTILSIEGGNPGDDYMRFIAEDGSVFTLIHHQDCCESVSIEDVIGDTSDLLNSPILLAEESTNDPALIPVGHVKNPDSETWTFYKFATNKGYVTVRFYGSSNGYYSEGVSYEEKLA